MKIRIEVEVEPTELREFLGLPDVSELQEDVINSVRKTVKSGTGALDPISLFKTFVPSGLASVNDWQEVLTKALAQTQATTRERKAAAETKKKATRKRQTRKEDDGDEAE